MHHPLSLSTLFYAFSPLQICSLLTHSPISFARFLFFHHHSAVSRWFSFSPMLPRVGWLVWRTVVCVCIQCKDEEASAKRETGEDNVPTPCRDWPPGVLCLDLTTRFEGPKDAGGKRAGEWLYCKCKCIRTHSTHIVGAFGPLPLHGALANSFHTQTNTSEQRDSQLKLGGQHYVRKCPCLMEIIQPGVGALQWCKGAPYASPPSASWTLLLRMYFWCNFCPAFPCKSCLKPKCPVFSSHVATLLLLLGGFTRAAAWFVALLRLVLALGHLSLYNPDLILTPNKWWMGLLLYDSIENENGFFIQLSPACALRALVLLKFHLKRSLYYFEWF